MHKLTGAAKTVFQSIYTEVKMEPKKVGETKSGSIIEFYNEIFL